MADTKQDPWTTWVALTTTALAVMAAITTLYLGKFSSRAILLQGQETDQWAFFQAKSIKGHSYELEKAHLTLEMSMFRASMPKEASEQYQEMLAQYGEKIKKYEGEKEEIKKKAEALEKEKLVSQQRSGNFGFALIFLQIAIMLSSISVITKKKPLWYVGLFLSTFGLFFFLDGFYLFY